MGDEVTLEVDDITGRIICIIKKNQKIIEPEIYEVTENIKTMLRNAAPFQSRIVISNRFWFDVKIVCGGYHEAFGYRCCKPQQHADLCWDNNKHVDFTPDDFADI